MSHPQRSLVLARQPPNSNSSRGREEKPSRPFCFVAFCQAKGTKMRLAAILAFAAAGATAPPAGTPQTHAEIDVPRARAQQVIVQSRDFPAGGQSGWHVHPGTEVAYVTAGRLELNTKGKTTVLEPGDSFTMPRGVPHNGVNRGSDTARVVITLVVDKGVAPRRAVTAPWTGKF